MSAPPARAAAPGILYISYDGMLEPLGAGQVVAYVEKLAAGRRIHLDRPFERGKSGYKLIQYMACGLPVVASPVGVNREIVKQSENGFLAARDEEWLTALALLLDDAGLRSRLGAAGRRQAELDFSLSSQEPRLVTLFNSLARTAPGRGS